MFDEEAILQELTFKAVRSSGSGGQHVNKVSSKVELLFNISESLILDDEQKVRVFDKLQSRLTKESILILQCDETRSQHKNKVLIVKRFLSLLTEALKVPKKRKPTKVPKAVIRKRLKNKRIHSDKKANRKKPDID
ncbi:alternative ribosome rescue aminoacyl-tRNA hydrolase ArfB [uncultured Algibacter sp.]|uniref:alternative ribosome rescue aminoacyl-tRNA hydrolase ArfB n=1 Tax=uncultured Algibacter sp. TaxID=298659 RepID=UPI0026257C3C|nr:alternative ribosome rescue aminoacyl-tRNA hydrolase ArfB [uncultured Algibacter sp.]